MKKNLEIMALILLLALTFAGCSKRDEQSDVTLEDTKSNSIVESDKEKVQNTDVKKEETKKESLEISEEKEQLKKENNNVSSKINVQNPATYKKTTLTGEKENDNKQENQNTNNNAPNYAVEGADSSDSLQASQKVWVVDEPEKIIKLTPIEYSSPDKSIFTQTYMKENHLAIFSYQDGRLEIRKCTETDNSLIGVDVVQGDVGRVTLWEGDTIWLWGGYRAAAEYANSLELYQSYGNNGILPGNTDCVAMVQKWTPVEVIPEKGHWE